MKIPYTCPKCSEQFSRKWNMRYHCKTQHGFDPIPNIEHSTDRKSPHRLNNLKKPSQSNDITNTTRTPIVSIPAEKFLDLMHQTIMFEGIGPDHNENQFILDPTDSLDNTLDYLIENFVIVRKRDIEGISSHVCEQCLAFQFQYINKIGKDLTASERHQCLPSKIDNVNKLQNKDQEYKLILAKSYHAMTILAKSLFTGDKRMIVDSSLGQPFVTNLHVPKIRFNTITQGHWAWNPISNKITALTDNDILNFIKITGGTYCLVHVEYGIYQGYHLMFIQGAIQKYQHLIKQS